GFCAVPRLIAGAHPERGAVATFDHTVALANVIGGLVLALLFGGMYAMDRHARTDAGFARNNLALPIVTPPYPGVVSWSVGAAAACGAGLSLLAFVRHDIGVRTPRAVSAGLAVLGVAGLVPGPIGYVVVVSSAIGLAWFALM